MTIYTNHQQPKDKQDMKRTVFALCATVIALSATAQGTIKQRLQGHPKIDSLVSEMEALGRSVRVSYYYDGRLHKTIMIGCGLMKDYQPTPPTGDPKRDSLMHKQDSVRQMETLRLKRAYDTMRRTCQQLTDEAKESYSWEYHRNGVDSVRCTIALGEYVNGDTMQTYRHNRDVFYYNAPEIITFRYDPWPGSDVSPWRLKGYATFRYEYTPDSVSKMPKERSPFDKEAYKRLLQPILKQKGITTRQFYVYHDSTYTFEQKDWDNEEFVIRSNTISPRQLKSETWGTVYTLGSSAQADTVLSQIKQATWAFLNEHPDMDFSFNPTSEYHSRALEDMFHTFDSKRVPSSFYVYVHRSPIPGSTTDSEHHIVILESKGDMMVPMEWQILKSWKNGKVEYDKKAAKNLTPKQARDNTSASRSVITHGYEPID